MLEIKNLKVRKGEIEIIKNLNFNMNESETHVIFGPNGSGKSTLAKVIMGIPGYKISGRIRFKGKEITRMSPEQRAKLGIALAFQFPPEIKNVKLSELLEKIKRKEIKIKDSFAEKLLRRDVNVGFSGGEKKISELLQVFSLNPKLAILDEIDSGLDMHRLSKIGKILKNFRKTNNTSFLIITHSGEILKFLNPDKAHVMLDGKIVCSSTNWKRVWKTIRRYGYEKCKICKGKLFANKS